jgi:hypothetical protein
LIGTLRYMSPEQAGGQRALVDHRTDVYSLGATLYELLTLQPIFDGSDRQTLLRQILHDEPAPPRSIDRSIPPELETIVLKAIGKTPAERYATARELGEDLQRFLEDRPIQARRPSLVEKSTKWARRHKAVVVSAVVVLLLAVAGLAVTTVVVARERDEAEKNFTQAREVVDELLHICEDELADRPDLEGVRWRLLDEVRSYYQDFIHQHRNEPALREELEKTRDKVKDILTSLTTLMRSFQYMPLKWPEVQEELQLNAEQRRQLATIDEKWHQVMDEAWRQRLPAVEREKRRMDQAQSQQTEVAKILNAAQFDRFRQIALQALGPVAFFDPDVAKELNLTAEQKKQLRTILQGCGPNHFGHFGPYGPGPDNEKRALEQIRRELQPEQWQKWTELIGKPSQGLAAYNSKGMRGPREMRGMRGGGRGRSGGSPPRTFQGVLHDLGEVMRDCLKEPGGA